MVGARVRGRKRLRPGIAIAGLTVGLIFSVLTITQHLHPQAPTFVVVIFAVAEPVLCPGLSRDDRSALSGRSERVPLAGKARRGHEYSAEGEDARGVDKTGHDRQGEQ